MGNTTVRNNGHKRWKVGSGVWIDRSLNGNELDGSGANSRRISQLSRTSKGMQFQVNGGKGCGGDTGTKERIRPQHHNTTTCVGFLQLLSV
jgi:hypothetical protein